MSRRHDITKYDVYSKLLLLGDYKSAKELSLMFNCGEKLIQNRLGALVRAGFARPSCVKSAPESIGGCRGLATRGRPHYMSTWMALPGYLEEKMNIRLYPDPCLDRRAYIVSYFDADFRSKAEELANLMVKSDGIGIAATQVGWMERVFVMKSDIDKKNYVFCNPKLIHRSGISACIEGCLSFPGIFLPITCRFSEICISYNDIYGKKHAYTSKNSREAMIIQHEIDHLDGVLFLDRASDDDIASIALQRKLLNMRENYDNL